MNAIKAKKAAQNKGSTIFIVVNSVLLLLVIFRIFFCVAILDEAFNVGQAFRALQGNQYLVENWDYFQTGGLVFDTVSVCVL